jgi:hypothetical protein
MCISKDRFVETWDMRMEVKKEQIDHGPDRRAGKSRKGRRKLWRSRGTRKGEIGRRARL